MKEYSEYIKESSKGSISRKQAGVIFRAFKTGELAVTQEQVSWMYNNAVDEYPMATTDSTWRDIASKLSVCVSAIFDGNLEVALKAFNLAEGVWNAHYEAA